MIATDELLSRFAESVGKPAEARLYLELFQSEHPERFALIATDGALSDAARSALATDLLYLRAARLTPVVMTPDPASLRDLAGPVAVQIVTSTDGARDACRDGDIAISGPGDLTEWVAGLESRKVVILGAGGLRHSDGSPISLVDVTTERDALSAPGALAGSGAHRLANACRLLDAAPHRLTVALTSPLDLLRELFTVRGAGTLLRFGSPITVHSTLPTDQRDDLERLLAEAFGRRLRASFWERPEQRVLVAADWRGAAILEPCPMAPYLSKFAVGQAARGEGVGRDLWRALRRETPRLLWRAREKNPISEWYARQATGFHRVAPWTVYWRGLEPDELSAAIDFAVARPEDFEPVASAPA